ncbi:hypothetical protein [Nonlabens xiamenensis]|uniref:hypothetical protein n=1 Tax=Nonlabens xiamenensis TaxID=2341043 RepID=UPI000F611F5A|nr:hypothetical protein [Nonlabens xiamenensis]
MKALKKILFVLVLFNAVMVFAGELAPSRPGKNITTISFDNVRKGHLLSVKDASELVLYKENIVRDGSYTQYFDLTTLEDGIYSFELNKDVEIVTKKFNVKNGAVKFIKDSENVFFKPTVSLRKNRIYISQLSTDNQDLEVQVYYEGVLIQEDVLNGEQYLKRIYQLAADKPGTYIVLTKSAGHEFIQEFQL